MFKVGLKSWYSQLNCILFGLMYLVVPRIVLKISIVTVTFGSGVPRPCYWWNIFDIRSLNVMLM